MDGTKPQTMTEENKALIRRWFEEVWNKGRGDAIEEMVAADCVIHGLDQGSGEPVRGPADFKKFHNLFREAFPDIIVTVDDAIAEGDMIAARCSVRGQHLGNSLGIAASKAPVDFTGMVFLRVRDGKFVEAWNSFDFLAMNKQIGAI